MTVVRMPDGTQVDFGDTPPDRIRNLIQNRFPAETGAASGQPVEAPAAPAQAAAAPLVEPGPPRSQVAMQAAGKGIADILGSPVDLPVGIFNLATMGLNSTVSPLLGTDPVPLVDFSLSDVISGVASKGAEKVGIPMSDDVEDSALYNPIRFATGAGGAGGLLSLGAKSLKKAAETKGRLPGISDAFVRPYVSNPGRTIAGDVAGGAGAGVGLDMAESMAPDSPWAGLAGMLLGGVGGSTAGEAAHFAGRTARDRLPPRYANNVPIDPMTTLPVSRSEKEQASRIVQAQAADPMSGVPGGQVAADTIGEQAATFRSQGLPVPSSGTISGNAGLMEHEGGQRVTNQRVFREKDDEIKAAGSERINQIRDPDADQSLVREAVPARKLELEQARDAEALPLLRQAEASGAVVNLAPVVDKIDGVLASTDRSVVDKALGPIRERLHTKSSERADLKTDIADIYETRKEISAMLRGETDNPNVKFAKKELIAIRDELDAQINEVAPEFGEYLTKYRAGSEPLDVFKNSAETRRLIEKDPRTVAKAIFGDEYGAPERLDEVAQLVGNTPEAKRAWKAAVADVVTDRITSPTKLDASENFAVEVAKAERFFKQHREYLAKVFDGPGEMSALQQGQALLQTLKNAGLRPATAGSNTAEKWSSGMKAAEVALKAKYGILKGGGILRTLRIAAAALPNNQEAVQRLVLRAAFDPELMQDLLTGKIRNLDYYASNGWLRTAVAGETFAERKASPRKSVDFDLEAVGNQEDDE